MFATFLIAFREFLEAFLIIGVFLGISKKLNLKREKEICLASFVGFVFILLITSGTYLFGGMAHGILTEENADYLESYLLIFSGFFISYVVFSLHDLLGSNREKQMTNVHKRFKGNVFDFSLFLTIVFLVAREGFEIALFTASVSLFSEFIQNIYGMLFGFSIAGILSLLTYFAFVRLPVSKIFRITEYLIILLGAALVQTGITKLFETRFHILLSSMFPFHLKFLPGEDSLAGHILQGFFGIDQQFSAVRLGIMLVYIGIIYSFFMRKKHKRVVHN